MYAVMTRSFLNVFVVVVAIAFCKNNLFNEKFKTVAVAQVTVTQMWNSSDSVPGDVDDGESKEHVVIHGNASHLCSLDISIPPEWNIIVEFRQKVTGDYFFFWVERLGMLNNRQTRFTFVKDIQSICYLIFKHNHIQFNMQGDVSLLLKEASAADSTLNCTEGDEDLQNSSNKSLPFACPGVLGVNETIMCYSHVETRRNYRIAYTRDEHICKFNFGSNCLGTLKSDGQVSYKCVQNIESPKRVIVYNTYEQMIDLTLNNIKAIEKGTFRGLLHLTGLDLSRNRLTVMPDGVFEGLDNLESLYLKNNQLETLGSNVFQDVKKLIYLLIDVNKLRELPDTIFHGLTQLKQLHLQNNQLVSLRAKIVDDLSNLELLNLGNNRFVELDKHMFRGLRNLQALALHRNSLLERLPAEMFEDIAKFGKLFFLELSECNIKAIPNIPYKGKLRLFNLRGNPLTEISKDTFTAVNWKIELAVTQHEICECYVDKNVVCEAEGDRSSYLTCDRLLSDRVLVVLMWVIGLNALGGNIFVLIWKRLASDRNSVQNLLLTNLALSDFLMGIYMILIASADIYFGENFPMKAESWRSGITCRISGAVSIISSEGSVFFVTLISIDRYMNIKFPYSTKKFNTRAVLLVSLVIWFFAIALGVVPSTLAGQDFKFYDNSHVCIGLPLALTDKITSEEVQSVVNVGGIPFIRRLTQFDLDGKLSGMYFSTAMFLGLNGVCYLIILL